jgi:hypothetical protein
MNVSSMHSAMRPLGKTRLWTIHDTYLDAQSKKDFDECSEFLVRKWWVRRELEGVYPNEMIPVCYCPPEYLLISLQRSKFNGSEVSITSINEKNDDDHHVTSSFICFFWLLHLSDYSMECKFDGTDATDE